MLTERFEQALVFATRVHAQQKRKGGDIPYLAHLLSVAALVLEQGGGEDEAIAALLHDAVEDQGGAAMHAKILEQFGPVIAGIVMGCSDTDQEPKPPWKQRKRDYIAHLAHASPSVLLVSLCDKVHNARSILGDLWKHGESAFAKFRGGREGTIWYYRTLADAFRNRHPPHGEALVSELERIVADIERITGIDGRSVSIGAILTSKPQSSAQADKTEDSEHGEMREPD